MAMLTIDTLKTLRNEKAFNLLFDDVNTKRENLDVDEPSMPRNEKYPNGFSWEMPYIFSQIPWLTTTDKPT
ncbi:hypothetical protein DPMN_138716 [Dreissena polymorpha]|uniref:Uncharacterized protein n=1 Tax=Dreissena polymorpha TaxID=45954 RepID=A0A9D4G7P9_DREPO|nr:hypothetical protein DPMN_138716 [Dreissena polymorpha]